MCPAFRVIGVIHDGHGRVFIGDLANICCTDGYGGEPLPHVTSIIRRAHQLLQSAYIYASSPMSAGFCTYASSEAD